ncbi:hypothetical protein [Bradyrhizobium sp. USDA 4350]
MAADLRNLKIDLGDEREVVQALIQLRYSNEDVFDHMDEAIELARAAPKNLSSILFDGVAMIVAAGVLLAWYVVLCPAGA